MAPPALRAAVAGAEGRLGGVMSQRYLFVSQPIPVYATVLNVPLLREEAPMRVLSLSLVGGILLTSGTALAELPAYYVGAGVRTGFGDPTSAVINAKVQLTRFDDVGVSVRPELILGDVTEFRLPVTVEAQITNGIYPFVGAGIAVNTDGLNRTDPMITGGADFALTRDITLKTELNLIFQTGISDTDLEFVSTLNYTF